MAESNGVILQTFQWHSSDDGSFWRRLQAAAPELAERGYTAVWIPPCYKGAYGPSDTGYSTYDLFDLGEFPGPWEHPIRTKYGTCTELKAAVTALHHVGLHVYADVVINHKMGGSKEDDIWAVQVDPKNRNMPIGDWHKRTMWTRFDFETRSNRYSSMKWRSHHFDAVENNEQIFKIKGKQFEAHVDSQYWNYDFLMGCDLDYDHPQVTGEIQYWGKWFYDQLSPDGFRFDTVKHVRSFVFRDWLDIVRDHAGRHLFAVGEYWSGEIDKLHRFIGETEGRLHLFDVPLHFHFHDASKASAWEPFHMPDIFSGTLTEQQPALSVTFVDNHDSQTGQSLESWVKPWFKPIAYALILLRREGYPCVFIGDLEHNLDHRLDDHSFLINRFLTARRTHAFGDQHDYFDHPRCIGWVRTGDAEHPGTMAVVMSNGDVGYKYMNCFRPYARFRDVTEHFTDEVVADASGVAQFRCPAGSVSVWIS
jgi:alpha-amylase